MGITVIRQTAACDGLRGTGEAPRPLSVPAPQFRDRPVELAGAGGNRTGVWESDRGRFERASPHAEVMHILKGRCTFTPDGQNPISLETGDSLFFPANTRGVWDITEPLRKVYVVFEE